MLIHFGFWACGKASQALALAFPIDRNGVRHERCANPTAVPGGACVGPGVLLGCPWGGGGLPPRPHGQYGHFCLAVAALVLGFLGGAGGAFLFQGLAGLSILVSLCTTH